ncbi:MAG: nitroreductase family protein [Desulfobacteraceae bacterium]
MSLITIDESKCKKDGICSEVCPVGIIGPPGDDTPPVMVKGGEKLCIECGHCVAVCPHGALTHERMDRESCPQVEPEILPGPESVEHFLRSRRSVRAYKNKSVDKDSIERLIGIASHAPSGHNRQPVRWNVIHDRNRLDNLISHVVDWMRYMIKEQPEAARMMNMERVVAAKESGIDTICRGAPHVITAHGLKEDRTASAACVIAVTYLDLAAPSLGLGTCWAGFFNAAATFWPPMKESLALPAGHEPYASMMIGYPKYRYHRLPLRKPPEITWG